MAYRILFTTQASRQFDKLPKAVQEALGVKIHALADNPRPQGSVKISGTKLDYRIRAGDYRLLYSVQDDERIVLVVAAGHRREIYR